MATDNTLHIVSGVTRWQTVPPVRILPTVAQATAATDAHTVADLRTVARTAVGAWQTRQKPRMASDAAWAYFGL